MKRKQKRNSSWHGKDASNQITLEIIKSIKKKKKKKKKERGITSLGSYETLMFGT